LRYFYFIQLARNVPGIALSILAWDARKAGLVCEIIVVLGHTNALGYRLNKPDRHLACRAAAVGNPQTDHEAEALHGRHQAAIAGISSRFAAEINIEYLIAAGRGFDRRIWGLRRYSRVIRDLMAGDARSEFLSFGFYV